jgi:hypothetical protein
MAATTYKINKTLHLDGKTYYRGTDAKLDIPDELRDKLISNRTIQVQEPEAPAVESADKRAK